MLDAILTEFPKYFPEVNNAIAGGIPIFARVAGLMRTTPFLQRSEIPMIVKVGFTFIFTVIFLASKDVDTTSFLNLVYERP